MYVSSDDRKLYSLYIDSLTVCKSTIASLTPLCITKENFDSYEFIQVGQLCGFFFKFRLWFCKTYSWNWGEGSIRGELNDFFFKEAIVLYFCEFRVVFFDLTVLVLYLTDLEKEEVPFLVLTALCSVSWHLKWDAPLRLIK